jgi:hypothetical protein
MPFQSGKIKISVILTIQIYYSNIKIHKFYCIDQNILNLNHLFSFYQISLHSFIKKRRRRKDKPAFINHTCNQWPNILCNSAQHKVSQWDRN